jgi:hypothetical protein
VAAPADNINIWKWVESEPMNDAKPVAQVEFTEGEPRPVFEAMDGRQFIVDDDGNKIYGVWFIPREEFDTPFIVDERPF